MKTLSLEEFLKNPEKPLIKASIGEEAFRITVPGAEAAIIISESEYERLKASAQ